MNHTRSNSIIVFFCVLFPMTMLLSGCRSRSKLDVRGDLRVMAKVDILHLIREQALDKDSIFESVCKATEREAASSLEPVVPMFLRKFYEIATPEGRTLGHYFVLQDRTRAVDDPSIGAYLQELARQVVDRDIEIIRKRIDMERMTGVKFEKQGSRGFIITISDVGDTTGLRQLLLSTGLLEFRLPTNPELVRPIVDHIDQYLRGASPEEIKRSRSKSEVERRAEDSLAYSGLSQAEKIAKFSAEHPFSAILAKAMDQKTGRIYVMEQDHRKITEILAKGDIQPFYAGVVDICFGRPVETSDHSTAYEVYFLNPVAELTGKSVTNANAEVGEHDDRPTVNITMNEEGARVWEDLTRANINKQIAIVLDGEVYSAPVVQSVIHGGASQITGMRDMAEAKYLRTILKEGALPAPFESASFTVVH